MEKFNVEQMNYINKLLNDTHSHYENKMQQVYTENKQLRKANTKQQQEIRKLRRIINSKKKQNKQHFRNGKRGTIKNG